MFEAYEDIVTIEDCCYLSIQANAPVEHLVVEMLKIGKNNCYRLLKSGKLKGFKIGRVWKISRLSVEKYVLEQSNLFIS